MADARCRVASFRLKDSSKDPPGRTWSKPRSIDDDVVFERKDEIILGENIKPYGGVKFRTKWVRVRISGFVPGGTAPFP